MNREDWFHRFNGRVDACERWFHAWQGYMESLSANQRFDGEWEHHKSYRGHQEAREELNRFLLTVPLPAE